MHTLDALLCSAVKQILMGIPSFQCHQDINLPGEACILHHGSDAVRGILQVSFRFLMKSVLLSGWWYVWVGLEQVVTLAQGFQGTGMQSALVTLVSALKLWVSLRAKDLDSPHGFATSPFVTVILDSPGRILASFFVASTVTAPGAGDSFEAFQPLRSFWATLRRQTYQTVKPQHVNSSR
jgi:hypothetical protein